jgi:membrane protease YdiL (CAAX protease family)
MLSVYNPFDLLLIVAVLAFAAYAPIAGRKLARTPPAQLNLIRRYWLTTGRAVLVSLVILIDWRWAGRPWATLGFDIPVGLWGRVGFAVDAAIVVFYAYMLLLRKLTSDRAASARRSLDKLHILPRTPGELAVFCIVAMIASPFEELLFRGFLIWFFAPVAGIWGAVVLSSVLFGVGHAYQGWRGILRTSLIGLAFAIAYVLTHSLWWLMLAHIAFNLSGGLFAWRLKYLEASEAVTH